MEQRVPDAVQQQTGWGWRRWGAIGGGVVLLLVILVLIGVASGIVRPAGISSSNKKQNAPTPNQANSRTSQSATTGTPTRSQTLLDLATVGRMMTPTFSVTGEWTVEYSMHCTAGTTSNFAVTTYHGDGRYEALLENVITGTIAKTQHVHERGDWYLTLDGQCPWHVRVTGVGTEASQSAGGKTLLDLSGTGSQSTRTFTAAESWTLHETFTCSGYTSNFSITSYHSDRSYGDLLESLITGHVDKTQDIHRPGAWYLKIDGACPWHVTVKG